MTTGYTDYPISYIDSGPVKAEPVRGVRHTKTEPAIRVICWDELNGHTRGCQFTLSVENALALHAQINAALVTLGAIKPMSERLDTLFKAQKEMRKQSRKRKPFKPESKPKGKPANGKRKPSTEPASE